jgi:hypothetical protein
MFRDLDEREYMFLHENGVLFVVKNAAPMASAIHDIYMFLL